MAPGPRIVKTVVVSVAEYTCLISPSKPNISLGRGDSPLADRYMFGFHVWFPITRGTEVRIQVGYMSMNKYLSKLVVDICDVVLMNSLELFR